MGHSNTQHLMNSVSSPPEPQSWPKKRTVVEPKEANRKVEKAPKSTTQLPIIESSNMSASSHKGTATTLKSTGPVATIEKNNKENNSLSTAIEPAGQRVKSSASQNSQSTNYGSRTPTPETSIGTNLSSYFSQKSTTEKQVIGETLEGSAKKAKLDSDEESTPEQGRGEPKPVMRTRSVVSNSRRITLSTRSLPAAKSMAKSKEKNITKETPVMKRPARMTRRVEVKKSQQTTRTTKDIEESSKTPVTRPRRTRSDVNTPTPETTTEKPKKRGRKRAVDVDNEEEEPQVPKHGRKSKKLPIISETYKLSYVFKGHTESNIPAKSIDDEDMDDAKDLWCCEFEPKRQLKNQIGQPNILAICGSYTILFLDTQLARYTRKYTHPEVQEIFYCMAWTTLTGPELLNTDIGEEDPSCNILAVAGRLGSIKLLSPLQNECYRYMFGHGAAVLKLTFAKSEPRWLLSASADRTVRLWDIGSPTSKEDDSVCLARFSFASKCGAPTALSISHDLTTLMVGFEDGDMIRYVIKEEQLESFRARAEKHRSKRADKRGPVFPSTVIEPTMIYSRGDEWHAGYIDDIYILGQNVDESNALCDKIISRGAEDMEILVWDPKTSTKKDADIFLSLKWPDSAGCTAVRYKVIEAEGQTVLLAGEYEGQIYIYNLGDMKKSRTLSDNSKQQYKPTRMLSHPTSSELIRDVCCSDDTRTIVAVDNNNTIFIWNCADRKQ